MPITVVKKGLFKKSIFQWTELFCQTVKLNRPLAFFKKIFLKTELLKQFYDKFILPEMPEGIINQFFFFNQYFCQKMTIFPKKANKRAVRASHFGPKLPPGVNKNCVKKFNATSNFSMWHYLLWEIWYKYDNKYDRYEQQIWHQKITKNNQNHHKSPPTPTNQSICTTNMIFSHYMGNYKVCQREKC